MIGASPEFPLGEHGAQVSLGTFRVPAPSYRRAFDHPETRAAWERTHRRLRRRERLRVVAVLAGRGELGWKRKARVW